MANLNDVRRIALRLPHVSEDENRSEQVGFGVLNRGKVRGFAWVWMERKEPKKARVPNPDVLALRTASLDEKESMLASDPDLFFTEPHYNGYPAVLLRLSVVEPEELEEMLIEAWKVQAPKELVKEFESSRTP